MTAEQLKTLFPRHPQSFIDRNADTSMVPLLKASIAKEKRVRQSSKPVMNALEIRFYARLCALYPSLQFHAQSIRWKLGNGIWYKPDVVCFGIDGKTRCWEVKGPFAYRGGFENLKVAAYQYPEVMWILVWEDGGRFVEQRILP